MLNRTQLINLVQQLMNGEGGEKELDAKLELLRKNVTDPNVSDYIYWSEHEMNAEQIIDKALSYKPIQL